MTGHRFVAGLFAAVLLLLPNEGTFASPRSPKDLFFDQLEAPAESINTGFKYWIQLHRNGQTRLVDNRYKFASGDEIRFQLIPNVSGYAHIVLAEGSTGRQKILFPNPKEPNGRVMAGKQVSIPASGYLRFDNNSGNETLRIVISRQALSAAALLQPNGNNWVEVAADSAGKPFQNENCVVAFGDQENIKVDFDSKVEGGLAGDSKNFSKDLDYVAPSRQAPLRRVSRIRTPRNRVQQRRRPARSATSNPFVAALRPGGVTVVNIEPTENLGADIVLVHR